MKSVEAFEDLSGSLGIMIMMAAYPTVRFKRQLMFTFSNLLGKITNTIAECEIDRYFTRT